MATCDECLHFTVCEALEQGNGIKKVHPIQCGCFKDKANVVEVVRCKECKHYIPKENLTDEYDNPIGADGLCDNTDTYTDETDFCSYGELKELGK